MVNYKKLEELQKELKTRSKQRDDIRSKVTEVQSRLVDEQFYDEARMHDMLADLEGLKETFVTLHNKITDDMDPDHEDTIALHTEADLLETQLSEVYDESHEWLRNIRNIIVQTLRQGHLQASHADPQASTGGSEETYSLPSLASSSVQADRLNIPTLSGGLTSAPPSSATGTTTTTMGPQSADQLKQLLQRRTDAALRAEKDAADKSLQLVAMTNKHAAERASLTARLAAMEKELKDAKQYKQNRAVSTPSLPGTQRFVHFDDTTVSQVIEAPQHQLHLNLQAQGARPRILSHVSNPRLHATVDMSTVTDTMLGTAGQQSVASGSEPADIAARSNRMASRQQYLADLMSGRFMTNQHAGVSNTNPVPNDSQYVTASPDLALDVSALASFMSHNTSLMQSFLEDSKACLISQRESSEMPKSKLQVFDGDPLNYWTFMKAFDDLVGSSTMRFAKKLNTLVTHCCTEVKRMLAGCQLMSAEEGYNKARSILRAKCGNPFIISQAWKCKLANYPKVTSPELMESYSEDLLCCYNTLLEMGHVSEFENSDCLSTIASKLDNGVRGKWRKLHRSALARNEVGSFRQLVELIMNCADEQTDPVYNNARLDKLIGGLQMIPLGTTSVKARDHRHQKDHKKQSSSFATFLSDVHSDPDSEDEFNRQIVSMATEFSGKTCLVCAGQHYLSACPVFVKKSPKERLEIAREKRLCLLCLSPGHYIDKCTQKWRCQTQGCVFRHHNLLHGSFALPNSSSYAAKAGENKRYKPADSTNLIDLGPDEKENHVPVELCLNTAGFDTEVDIYKSITMRHATLPITPVIVFADRRQLTTYALLDPGSTASVCTNRLVNLLKPALVGTAKLTINTINGKKDAQGNVFNLDIKGCTGEDILPVFEVVSLEEMPISTNHIAAAGDLQEWKHLHHLPIATVEARHVDLLVGQDNAHLIKPLKTVEGKHLRDPYAVITPLGWTIYGMRNKATPAIEMKDVSLNVVLMDNEECLQRLETQVSRLWSLDKVPEAEKMSPIDRRVVQQWDDEIKLVDGYIQLPIPLMKKKPDFPDNRAAVLARLRGLGKRLQKDKALHKKYHAAMLANFEKGYVKRVFHTPLPGLGWHLTQLPVEHKRKEGVVRPVWNGGFIFRGRALNDEVHQGPDMTNRIVSVMVNFRLLPVAVMGDIRQMYNQVHVPAEQQDLMRFLYWEDGDPSKEVIDCCLTYHMFGGGWSPSACTYALRKTIELAKLDPNGEAARTILKAFYVDDCVKSIKDVTTGITLFKEIISVLGTYHFDFTKLVSNKKELLDAFPEEKRAAEAVDLDFDGGRVHVQHSLGQRWQPEDDVFFFVCCFLMKPKTRRELLSTLSTLYDPLGLSSPFLIPAKRMLQELSKRGLTWDDELPQDVAEQWASWVKNSECISNFRVPRWVEMSSLQQTTWLVYFCDASEVAYGAVCYLCVVDKDEMITKSNLLMSRCRLAPLKTQSIPRLELCAALVAAQLNESILEFLDVTPTRTLFWSDSTLVLRYLQTESSTLKTFISNRVSAIQQLTQREDWRHVPTDLNPADCLSRGITAQELVDSSLWLHGPEYLKKPESEWPEQPEFLKQSNEDMEVKKPKQIYSAAATIQSSKQALVINMHERHSMLINLWTEISTWDVLIRRVAWLLFALDRFRNSHEAIQGTGVITCINTDQALVKVIKAAQDLYLPKDEQEKKAFTRLFPMVRNGVVCVGGRLVRAALPTEFKQPYVLPSKNRVADMFVLHCHDKVYHAGVTRTLMETRKSVWVLGGRKEVSRILNMCMLCKKYKKHQMTQVMADLPPYRLEQGTRPFTNIGVDYMGPLQIKVGRSLVKRYVCLIVCSVTRAVHLEPATELTTSSFLNAFTRFVSRRGKPKRVLSDNGTNFVGAKSELDRETAFWNAEGIHHYCADHGISWQFNPPAASHFGGMWERQNRTIRSLMLCMTGGAKLTEESFLTLLCQIESSLNSRPLTKLNDDPNDPSPLTPNLILLGESSEPVRGMFFSTDQLRKSWKQSQFLADCFWKRWTLEYLADLQKRTKWLDRKDNLRKGSLVLVIQDNLPRHVWPLGLVEDVHVGHDGLVRAADLRTSTGSLTRPIAKLVLLEADLTVG